MPTDVSAQLSGFSFDPSADSNDTLKSVAEFAALLIQILTFVSLLVLSLAGDLLGTEFITGDEAMAALRPMWIFVRNLTNIGFVVALIYLSFSNLFASFGVENSQLWQIKDKLPRIIFAIIAVNFSLLGFRLIIDAVHVGTVAILGIADVQLESQSATSVEKILKDKTWTLTSENSENPFSANNDYALLSADNDGTARENAVCEPENEDKIYYVDQFQKKTDDPETYENKVLVCTSFFESINDVFCPAGTDDDSCFFKIKEDLSKSSFISTSDNTAQNLFMSFGTVFMRLERLPSLAADVNDILQVIDNTLFSLILAIAYGVVLVGFFVVLLVRVVVLWLGLVFSPVIVAGSIMGLGSGEISEKIGFSKFLIAPLKIAAAFAVSFVMMSGMIEFRPNGKEGIFEFGAGLSSIAIDEYAILWQVITILIFWETAKWAMDGIPHGVSDFVTGKLMKGAEDIGGVLAKSVTTEAQVFTVKTEEGDKKVSLDTLRQIPQGWAQEQESKFDYDRRKALSALGADGYYTPPDQGNLNSIKAENYDLKSQLGKRKALTDIVRSFENEEKFLNGNSAMLEKINQMPELKKALEQANDNKPITAADLKPEKIAAFLNSSQFKSRETDITKDGVMALVGTYDATGGSSAETDGGTPATVQPAQTSQTLEATQEKIGESTLKAGEIGVKNQGNNMVTVALPTNGTFTTTDINMKVLNDPNSTSEQKQQEVQNIMNFVGNAGVDKKVMKKDSKDDFMAMFGGGKNKKEVLEVLNNPNNGMTAAIRNSFKKIFEDDLKK